MKVLDIGCGRWKTKGAIGVDIIPSKGVNVICDLNKVPYPFLDESVDKIMCFEVIEHLKNYKVILKEFHRILKKDGELRLSTNNVNSLINRLFKTYEHKDLDPEAPGTHKHLFTISELKNLVESNKFRIIETKMLPFPCSYEHKKLRKFLNPLRNNLNRILPNSLRERTFIIAKNIRR